MYPDSYQHIQIVYQDDLESRYNSDKDDNDDDDLIQFDYDNKHTIYIITDDFCYSGSQMAIEIQKLFDCYEYPHLQISDNENNENFSIYVNVVGMTNISSEHLKTIFQVKLIIPDKCYIVADVTYNGIFNKYCKEYNYDIKHKSVDMYYFTMNDITFRSFTDKLIPDKDLSLIYLSFKYPDKVSTIPYLCYFPQRSNIYFIAYNDYNNKDITTLTNSIRSKYSSLEYIFQLKDMEQFENLHPGCVYTINSKNESIHILKLIKNCNYSLLSYYREDHEPQCNLFCYKPFYKKKEYSLRMRNVDFTTETLNDIRKRQQKNTIKTPVKRSVKKMQQYQYEIFYNDKIKSHFTLPVSLSLSRSKNDKSNESSRNWSL